MTVKKRPVHHTVFLLPSPSHIDSPVAVDLSQRKVELSQQKNRPEPKKVLCSEISISHHKLISIENLSVKLQEISRPQTQEETSLRVRPAKAKTVKERYQTTLLKVNFWKPGVPARDKAVVVNQWVLRGIR